MWGCLFCKRKQRLFKISMAYGQTSSPIKNYIIEFLGPCEQYLHDDHGVCSACVFVLNNLLYIRKCMNSIVAAAREDNYSNIPHFKFSYVYKHFLENLQKLRYEDCTLDLERPDGNTEETGQEETDSLDNVGIPPNGMLQQRRKSVNMPDAVADTRTCRRRYKCADKCLLEFVTLKELTQHKVEYHGMLANYVCCECYETTFYDTKFVSPEDLKLHNEELHHRLVPRCFVCSLELATVEELHRHHREHKFHSYPCNYCDLFFLDCEICKMHMKEVHKEDLQAVNADNEYESDSDQEENRELLRIQRSSPYNVQRESQYEQRYDTPHANREVQNVFNRKRRRRRGHNWTRRKGWRSKSRMSTYSEPIARWAARRSAMMNFSEYYDSGRSGSSDDDDDREVARSMRNLRTPHSENGVLQRNRRALSRSTNATSIAEILPVVYECTVDDCGTEFDTLREMTTHKVDEHGMLANFVCYECYNTKFVSREDLKLHNDQLHHTLKSNCFMCSVELQNMDELQRHLKLHKSRSYRCSYCDLFFLDRQTCRTHMRDAHKGKQKRIRRFKQCTILDRIYSSSNHSPVRSSDVDDDKYTGQVLWRLQIRSSVKSLATLCMDVIKRTPTLDISNLRSDVYKTIEIGKMVSSPMTDPIGSVSVETEDNPDTENQSMMEILDSLMVDILEVQSELTIDSNEYQMDEMEICSEIELVTTNVIEESVQEIKKEDTQTMKEDEVATVNNKTVLEPTRPAIDVYTFVDSEEEEAKKDDGDQDVSRARDSLGRFARFTKFGSKTSKSGGSADVKSSTSSGTVLKKQRLLSNGPVDKAKKSSNSSKSKKS